MESRKTNKIIINFLLFICIKKNDLSLLIHKYRLCTNINECTIQLPSAGGTSFYGRLFLKNE
jgi:hypothetical protein